ncbi:MAG: hypothetical protein ABIP55_06710 [Tepidisphaeraceae bacterium]
MTATESSNTPSNSMAAPTAVIDLLNSLLEAELGSIFRFMGEGSPYLSRATVEVRKPLQEMVLAQRRRSGELADLIESLGTVPTPFVGIRRDEQYLAFLSLKFMLPKLVSEKKLEIERYDNALAGGKKLPQVPPEVPVLLNAHLAELRNELTALERAAALVATAKMTT